MLNLFTIDVEDWFHTSALEPYIDRERWHTLESRVEANVLRLLEMLAARRVRGTFFILGWVARRFPGLVREIAAHGHEIASHGWQHRLIYHLSPAQFQEYVRRAKHTLEDLIGQPVAGYRATSFSIVQTTLWALDILKEAGFIYDSSMYPVRGHDLYGIDGIPRHPFRHPNGLVEFPLSTLKIGGRNIPFGGGGYFRLFPYRLTKLCIHALNREGYPAIIYLHPWEIDPQSPRIAGADLRTRFRQYVNLDKTEGRIRKLLADFSFGPLREYVSAFFPTD